MGGERLSPEHTFCNLQEEFFEFRQEFREGQKEQITLLKAIAEQSQQIQFLAKGQEKIEKSMNEAFMRIRDLELSPGEEAIGKVKEFAVRRNRREDNLFLAKVSGVITLAAGIILFLIQKGP